MLLVVIQALKELASWANLCHVVMALHFAM
jgi:hypothetical protein